MTLPTRPSVPNLSGERFQVTYQLTGYAPTKARQLADTICIEQTVEFPASHVPAGDIQDFIVGQVVDFAELAPHQQQVTISYAIESAGSDLLQLLNVVLGLTSLLQGVTVVDLALPPALLQHYPGPQFGIAGLRQQTGVPARPLLCTALKPMGLSAQHLADLAATCAQGGLDLVKDDHGITDLPFCRFEERVTRISAAVNEANARFGRQCVYAANVTASPAIARERAYFAQQAGAGGLLVLPALTGFGLVHQLAADPDLHLPIWLHPSVAGGFTPAPPVSGFSQGVFYGQLPRLAGADVSIFASYGGRFPIEKADTLATVAACRAPFGGLEKCFPMVGGGMQIDKAAELRAEFGDDTIFLVGGGLHTYSDDLLSNVQAFVAAVSK